jgi:prolipoprotein diacylglyceryltransferase
LPVREVFAQASSAEEKLRSVFTGLFITGFGFFWFLFVIFIILLSFFGIVLWIWMLVDCAKRKFENENDKTTWILILALTGWIGAIIYYVMVKRKHD